jgi:hypothetical protein
MAKQEANVSANRIEDTEKCAMCPASLLCLVKTGVQVCICPLCRTPVSVYGCKLSSYKTTGWKNGAWVVSKDQTGRWERYDIEAFPMDVLLAVIACSNDLQKYNGLQKYDAAGSGVSLRTEFSRFVRANKLCKNCSVMKELRGY